MSNRKLETRTPELGTMAGLQSIFHGPPGWNETTRNPQWEFRVGGELMLTGRLSFTGDCRDFSRHDYAVIFEVERAWGAGVIVIRRVLVLGEIGEADQLAGVGRHPSHDGDQGGFGDLLGLVERFVIEHAADHIDVLLDLTIVAIELELGDAEFLALHLSTAGGGAGGTGEHFTNAAVGP